MSGRIPQQFIDELVNRVDIVDVIDARVPLKKAGREYTACCPFHDEKTPSFTVSPSKQFYHCFGCGAHGTAIGFLMEYEHLSFPEAIENLAHTLGLEIPREEDGTSDAVARPKNDPLYELLSRSDTFYRQQLRNHPQADQAVNYLKKRGLSGEIAAEFGIGFAPPGWDNLQQALGTTDTVRDQLVTAGMLIRKDDNRYIDRFRGRVMFPIRDRRGRTIGFGGRVIDTSDTPASAHSGKFKEPKYLNSPETPLFHKGRELYGLFEARKALRHIPRLLVVEGYMDVVALAQFGIRYTVATLGTATTREHLTQLFRITPEVVFCFDGDRAGRDAARRALENALPVMREGYELRFMFLPEGDDPDSRIRAIGRDAFESEIDAAKPFSQFFFDTLSHDLDMESIDGRARLVQQARPLLERLPQGVFQQMMLQRLSQLAQLDAQHLLGNPEPAPHPTSRRPRRPQRRPPGPRTLSPVRIAITALLNTPQLASQTDAPARLAQLDVPGVDILRVMIETLQANPHLNTGALLARFEGSEIWPHLARLAAEESPLSDDELATEFHASIEHLENQWLESRREKIPDTVLTRLSLEQRRLLKSPLRDLSMEQKDQLRDMLVDLAPAQPTSPLTENQ